MSNTLLRAAPSQAARPAAQRCPECGTDTVHLLARSGRVISYLNIAGLRIPADVPLPTCLRCRAEWLDFAASPKLEPALQEAYQQELRRRVREALEHLTPHCPQRELERLLGISPGYFSRLRAQTKHTSAPLLSLLALLAEDPEHRLAALRQFWTAGEPTPTELRHRRVPSRRSTHRHSARR